LDNLECKCVYSQVDDLKAKLAIQEVELKQKNEAADALIEIVRVETEKVSTEKALGIMMQYRLCLMYNIHV
jgi:dynein heavy chain